MIEYDTTEFIWSVFIISCCVFIILLPLAFILCTGCDIWEKRYNFDNNPEKGSKNGISNISNNSLKLFNVTFKRYSLGGETQVGDEYDVGYHQFTSDSLPINQGNYYSHENDTLVEIKNSGRLQTNLNLENAHLSPEEFLDVCDIRSCVSKISRNSFYSTYSPEEQHLRQQISNVDIKTPDSGI